MSISTAPRQASRALIHVPVDTPGPPVSSPDWSGVEFAAIMRRLPAELPISSEYEERFLPGPHWWRNQKQHLCGWFSELGTPGPYGRKSRNPTAQAAYNRLQCAPGLLWLAEALGEDVGVVERAAVLAGGQGRPATQCKHIRSVIPWSRIAYLASRIDRTNATGKIRREYIRQ